MPIPNGHDHAKGLVRNFRNQINFGGGFEDVKQLFEYAVALENQVHDDAPDAQYSLGDDDEPDELDDDSDPEDDEHGIHCAETGCGQTQATQPASTVQSVAEALTSLKQLVNAGILTDAEAAPKKAELLARL